MTTISEHFALLGAGDAPSANGQLLTRGIGVWVPAGQVLVGVDTTGNRHLLVPVEGDVVPEDHTSRGVALSERVLTTSHGDQRFADLSCLVSRLAGPFDQLVADVAGRLDRSGSDPARTIVRVLDDWRALLKNALGALSREAIVGLVGELDILERLARFDPLVAIDSWKGPTGATHDFTRASRSIEVKSTASASAAAVRISSLDQLDWEFVPSLHLAVVHLLESPQAPDIDQRVETLVELGTPRENLEALLNAAGYFPGIEVGHTTHYGVRSLRMWSVGPGFPALRGSSMDPVVLAFVTEVQYNLTVAGLPGQLSDLEVEALFAGWRES